MNVSIGDRWEAFVSTIVKDGRYGSASEVVREGLRLVEEREQKLRALTTLLNKSISDGGEASDAEIDAALEAKAAQLTKEGF
ncbi:MULTISPECIES: type II toxin-antitoxin system ParD family antitoxin [unclassified Ensifer]|uniref:type II toxin-antitoxin system ParD family antitoxin n=1 Tax=unclassified Ensifer TaxID=2633371 RepID=UPI00070F8A2C|nr:MULTISPECIES: type II toxin-antitoxin system ParD family antitoxin [unclassified Ensifer]MDP9633011.1 antitoxin ParD1/3/4 [Ensifer adhaerens]KQW61028.1 CopG family transcriptional regulator [Ensifer sp. Root1252]KQW76796.1 CopG family transcriptional regulator [Ensifer sp. Root127]KRC77933.1 CopG family transcriptional regulator [Ensifer sp. Root231]KRD00353.1 CopG family transcriptional regulator [Ensifer sp. Root258]